MKSVFVVDCSVALAWCFVDEATAATKKLLARMEGERATVPGWWFVELTNVLVIAERKGRIPAEKTQEFLALVETFDLEVDKGAPDRAFTDLLPLCRKYSLTAYDAIYLDLAIRRNLPLATLDERLRKAAKIARVKVLGI